jgi:hypothetical protein
VKQQYPVRHPPVPEAARRGEITAPQEPPAAPSPQLPHEQDESSHSQASATPEQQDIGRRARANAVDGTADTDRGPVADAVYNDKVAPDRGAGKPRG